MVRWIQDSDGDWSRRAEDLKAEVLEVWDTVSLKSLRELVFVPSAPTIDPLDLGRPTPTVPVRFDDCVWGWCSVRVGLGVGF